MEPVEIPPYFLCPISLQTMRDPVTLATGITYDRDGIEKWLFSGDGKTCPVTKQSIPPDCSLTPNHTLRRLIQAWCVANASSGVERIPTPRAPVDPAHIANLLDAAKSPSSRAEPLRRLKSIVGDGHRNRRCVEASGAVDVLASIVEQESREHQPSDDAISILYSLNLSEQALLRLVDRDPDFIHSLTVTLRRSSYDSRAYALLLLRSLVSVSAPVRLMGVKQELYREVVRALKERISYQATKAALRVLCSLSAWGSNKAKAVNAGAVEVLVELLLEEQEKRPCEMMMVVLDKLCRCAEGRAAVVGSALGIAVVSRKICRVSPAASEAAVRILHSVATYSATAEVVQEMLQVGAVSKLCLMLQMDCGVSTRVKVKEILKLHSKAWRSSPCMTLQLLASYPSLDR